MKKALLCAAALTLIAGPALAQYGGGGHNSGGPRGSYLRSYGYGGGWYGGPVYYAPAPVYAYGGPVYYGYAPAYGYGYGYGGGAALAAGVIGGLALGALAARPYGYYPRRAYYPYGRGYRRW
jgi:hypothetical protein